MLVAADVQGFLRQLSQQRFEFEVVDDQYLLEGGWFLSQIVFLLQDVLGFLQFLDVPDQGL